MTAEEDPYQRPQADDEAVEEPGDGGPGEAAQLIAESVVELSMLARRHGLDLLAHLLDMTQIEADSIRQRNALRKL